METGLLTTTTPSAMSIEDLPMDLNSIIDLFNTNGSKSFYNLFINNTTNNSFYNLVDDERVIGKGSILIIAYGILVAVGLFGNCLVCHVIFRRKRMRTVTNIFIANLAVSDILLIILNVPFNIVKTLMSEWMLGDAMCRIMNMSLITSVYASTFTLTVIALDRQRVLLYPLRPRILKSGGMIMVGVIWLLSILLALPYGIYSQTYEVNVYVKRLLRCRSLYPSELFEQYLTVSTILLQYVIPLLIVAVTYGRIVRRIWERTELGAETEYQHERRSRHKKKSIKMLMIVVIVFASCWMPLNLYHILTDLHPDSQTFQYSSTAFFVCHWLAISSTCYNPFIYCWLNEAFRTEIRAVLKCVCISGITIHPRDNRMTESVIQSECMSITTKRTRFNSPGQSVMKTSLPSSESTGYMRCLVDKTDRCRQCEGRCVCRSPKSWKSIDATIDCETPDLLQNIENV